MRDIFISYAEQDSNISLKIAGELEGKGYTTWYYERDGYVPISHLKQTREAIVEAKAVFILSWSNSPILP